MKTIIALIVIFLLIGVFMKYPALPYVLYMISVAITITFRFNYKNLEITSVQAEKYSGFNIVFAASMGLFSLISFSDRYLFLKFQQWGMQYFFLDHKDLIESGMVSTVVLIGLLNISIANELPQTILNKKAKGNQNGDTGVADMVKSI